MIIHGPHEGEDLTVNAYPVGTLGRHKAPSSLTLPVDSLMNILWRRHLQAGPAVRPFVDIATDTSIDRRLNSCGIISTT